MSVSVCLCLCVCLAAIISIRKYTSDLHQLFFEHVIHGRGSVLLWRRGDMLCTSGFMDDVVFASTSPPG